MNANAFYAIGQSHTVCQDYARAGRTVEGPQKQIGRHFAIVADGCSGSGDSDVGARLIAAAALHRLEVYGDRFDPEWVIWRAADCARLVGIDTTCLDATLMCAFCTGEGHIRVVVTGDGVVAARRHDGKTESWTIDFGGAPAYLSYLLDRNRLETYLDQGFGGRIVTHSGDRNLGDVEEHTNKSVASLADFAWVLDLDPRKYDLVLLLSDGAQSFQRKRDATQVTSVPLGHVLQQVMAFKGTKGEFVVRRCRRFLRRFCSEAGWTHSDDFSVAAICLGGEER